jgi:hypothetical protein
VKDVAFADLHFSPFDIAWAFQGRCIFTFDRLCRLPSQKLFFSENLQETFPFFDENKPMVCSSWFPKPLKTNPLKRDMVQPLVFLHAAMLINKPILQSAYSLASVHDLCRTFDMTS